MLSNIQYIDKKNYHILHVVERRKIIENTAEINLILEELTKRISLSDTAIETIKTEYSGITNYLDNNLDNKYEINVFPQGSYNLGTTITPLPGNGEFDVDSVVEVTNKNESEVDAGFIKNLIGDVLKESPRYGHMLMDEKKRAWTINYETNSHVDVVPAIKPVYTNSDISITNKILNGYEYMHSSPAKFKEWFFNMSKGITSELIFEKNFRNSVKKLPRYGNGTILQKIVRLIKYHRNKYFEYETNEKIKPVSMIITILAAESYEGEKDLYSALTNVVRRMRGHILSVNGKDMVTNPIDQDENFADKWETHPERKTAFFEWLNQLEKDFSKETFSTRLSINDHMKKAFGDDNAKAVFTNVGKIHENNSANSNMSIDVDVGINDYGAGNRITNHNFYGGENY